MSIESLRQAMFGHLDGWALHPFKSDADYFAWQRRMLSPAELTTLREHMEHKRSGMATDEIAFYDATADVKFLPVLYSQRHDYYLEIGPRVASRLGMADSILDFGCGVGILTTFYARCFPDKTFFGIDRSPASIEQARERARVLGLTNVRFECCDPVDQAISGTYDCIVATHVLVQAEQDTGIPSRDWRTFERVEDFPQQRAFEERTGIGLRLDRLGAVLAPDGRLIIFEKTRQLARRVPFQRAMAGRNFYLAETPEPIRYLLVEEVADDGPLYVLQREQGPFHWSESPESDEGPPFDKGRLRKNLGEPRAPLYENHWPSAQRAWESLQGKMVLKESTRQESDGRQLHVELGRAEGHVYLYCANTFDQRQLVVFSPAGESVLEVYYQEIVGSVL